MKSMYALYSYKKKSFKNIVCFLFFFLLMKRFPEHSFASDKY